MAVQSAVKPGVHPNPYLQKTQFDNYYERKLHEERQTQNEFGQKMVLQNLAQTLQGKMQQANAAQTPSPNSFGIVSNHQKA